MSATDPLSLLVLAYRRELQAMVELAEDDQIGAVTRLRALRDSAAATLGEPFQEVAQAVELMHGMDAARCRSCGAEIVWIRTVAGAKSPCNAKRTLVTTPEGVTISGHESHYSSCPNANEHRKRKAPAK